MKNHIYKISCEYLNDADGNVPNLDPMIFEVSLHENIFEIINKLKENEKVPAQDVASFGLGLKLLGEVILRNPDHALCASLRPHLTEMMKEIKKKS